MKTNIAFFGTHEFAAAILEGLFSDPSISITTVFTQPDRKVGRKQIVEESPVKKLALRHGAHIEQPESLKQYNIKPGEYTAAVVAQYGLIIPQHILDAFPKGMLNVHGSLLPAYRGASPIQAALMTGEKTTGITIMIMDAQVDHGPVLGQTSIEIDPNDTFTTLAQTMAAAGSKTLLNILPKYLSGDITPQEQDHTKATFTKLLSKDDGKIDFTKSAETIYNLYRGLTPWPGIWCAWNEKRLKLLQIRPSEKNLPAGEAYIENKRLYIGCGQNSIEVLELQLEGKTPMDTATFLNGYKNFAGSNLK